MRKYCFLFFGIFCLGIGTSIGQYISTVAGNHAFTTSYSGDGGPATLAELNYPYGIAIDVSGDLYIADQYNNVVRRVSSSDTIFTVAGNYAFSYPTGGYSGDGGPATLAELNKPSEVAFDASGNFYITDYNNDVIRKVNASGIISTVAGMPTYYGYSGDGGPATSAELHDPSGIACDTFGGFYIADYTNNVIRKVSSSGTISTIAGNHVYGYSGDGGPATSAELAGPRGIALDASGNLFFSDWNSDVIRRINTSGTISTVAGIHTYGYSGDGGPATSAELYWPYEVACDAAGNLYISDYYNEVIRQVNTSGTISTVAGNHSFGAGYSGDGGPATSAELDVPYGIACNISGNLYIVDCFNDVIREVTNLTTGTPAMKTNNEEMLIYPNPNNGKFSLVFGHSIPITTGGQWSVEVYNFFAKKILEETLRGTQGDKVINLMGQPNGVYFYRVLDAYGTEIGNGKLIIDK